MEFFTATNKKTVRKKHSETRTILKAGVRKEAFRVYLSDAMKIQTYLSNDLTPKGIEAITSIARRIAGDGDNLKYAIQDLETAIEQARTEMAQGGR